VRVVFFAVGKEPEVKEIQGNLESMQALVGGWIQMVPIGPGLDLVCDEEGKFNGAAPNRYVPELRDVIAGPFFVSAHDGNGETRDLDDSEVKWCMEKTRWKKFA